jgi:drug/metabolite transporter (DMT)-like permease
VKGYLLIVAAAFFWGISATAAKLLLNQQIDTLLIVQTRVTFSALLMLLFLLVFRRDILRVSPADLWKFALLGIVGVAGANFTYYLAIKESTVATAILIQYTAPIAVMLYAIISRTEQLSPAKAAAALLSVAGCFLAVGAYHTGILRISTLGLVSAIASMVTFAFLNVYSRSLLQRHGLWTMTFYSFAFASLFWLVINPPWVIAQAAPSGSTWIALIALAIASVLIPHSLFFAGMQYIRPTRAIITSTLEPVVAIVSAALVLGELLQHLQVTGAVLVLVAVVLLQTVSPEEADQPGRVRQVESAPDA